ncbi:MAG TPA: polysaccharide deacetylase family protein [Alcanivorax sp.]|nr:polysaccharide deacetylase family protein [Alcanivorax sp.]
MNRIPDRRQAFILSLHDVAPHTWPLYQSFLDELQRPSSLACTLLAVPDFHRRHPAEQTPAFCRAMAERQAAGDELVLHGWSHSDEGPRPIGLRERIRRRILTHEGEFSALDEPTAYARIRDGLALFRRQHWQASGFVPPGWLSNEASRRAIRDAGFDYRTDAGALYRLSDGERLPLPTVVMSSRSAWRRYCFERLNQARLRRFQNRPVIRLALHPVDLRHPQSRSFWRRTIDDLSEKRRCVTKAQWLMENERLRESESESL